MQQIFSQQLRFKDDNKNGFPEWEEKKLGEVTKITAGGTPSTLRKDYWNGKIRWMNSGELNLKMVSEVENRITELGLKKSSAKLLPINCILIGLAGQGKTRGTIAINKVELCTNQSIGSIMPNPETYYSMFLYFNLDMRYEEIRRMSTGDGGRGGLNLKIIKDIKVNFPSIKEQTKIADFLSKIDNKINTINKQIERTKTYKKGVLQKMFV
ncbi:MAG: Uncharacterised protein [Formosa sp. Hel1_33_131]|nr:MAG: Uncharacterised protein [Formosa sp. Hel1_33_131]